MLEKIKGSWRKYVTNEYAIKRNGIVFWFIYSGGEKKVRKVSGKTELLISTPMKKELLFERGISRAQILRGIIAHYFLHQFRKKYSDKYTFELVKKQDLLFITDITGISGN